MKNSVRMIGDLAGVLGVVVCAVGGVARLAQTWYIAGVAVPAMFQLGSALMILACLTKLHLVSSVVLADGWKSKGPGYPSPK